MVSAHETPLQGPQSTCRYPGYLNLLHCMQSKVQVRNSSSALMGAIQDMYLNDSHEGR